MTICGLKIQWPSKKIIGFNSLVNCLRVAAAGVFWALIATSSREAEPANSPFFAKPGLEHLVVIVKDADGTSDFLTRTVGWTRNPLDSGGGGDPKPYGEAKVVWVDANGIWLELVQPMGPSANESLKGGDGQITEIDFEVENFHETFEKLRTRGITLVSWQRTPIKDGGKVSLPVVQNGRVVGRGEDYAGMVPLNVARGMDVELYQRGFSAASIIKRRNALRPRVTAQTTGPELNRVLVRSKDPEKAAKFFEDVLDQQIDHVADNNSGASVRTTSDGARFAWIDIEAVPASDSTANGKVQELAAQVNDITAYYAEVKARGVILVDERGAPLSADKRYVQSASGSRYAYFPENLTRGMRIRIYQKQ
jgi:catechol 2,3-dioxygenase-like lactoylglutathione lyase family enzyme